jgi:hypothetical protein
MKKILIPFALLTIAGACKKDGSSDKNMLLSKVFINNLLSEEYMYSSDKKPVRRNHYFTNQGQSSFAGFRLYEYTNGLITTELEYNKDNQLTGRTGITYNASNQISRMDTYGSDAVIDYYTTFEYENNRLSKVNAYSTGPVKKTGERFFKFDANGNLISIRRYWLNGNSWALSDSVTLTYGNKPLPAHWKYYEMTLQEFPYEKTFSEIPATSFYYYVAGGPPLKSNHTYTQKVYNGAGYLVSQHYRIDVDNAINITTYDYDLKYEYIE